MLKKLLAYAQYILPQHLLTQIAGCLANSRAPWLKNWLIKRFMNIYHVSLSEAKIDNPQNYACFNDFFTRELKPDVRPMDINPNVIVSPVDGYIAEVGTIHKKQLLQAKKFYFDLDTLLGNDAQLAEQFYDGKFITLYLAPHNYHRVHMPLGGKLIKTIYVPGKLFSVNRITAHIIPQLYSRNERLICVFDTSVGPMTVIFVGALIVGGIQCAWKKTPARDTHVTTENFAADMIFNKGDELGHFQLGSTVIILFGKDKVQWHSTLPPHSAILLGQTLGNGF